MIAFKFWPILGTHVSWAVKVLMRATPTMTRHLFIMAIYEDPWNSNLLSSIWQWRLKYLFYRPKEARPGCGYLKICVQYSLYYVWIYRENTTFSTARTKFWFIRRRTREKKKINDICMSIGTVEILKKGYLRNVSNERRVGLKCSEDKS